MAESELGKLESIEPQPVDVQPQGLDAIDSPATFNGQLKLSAFGFSPSTASASSLSLKSGGGKQRERMSSTAASPSPTPPLKRKSSRTASSSPSKKSRTPSGYAPPSTYSHLPELPDTIASGLILLLIGLNPGIETARSGNPYAHPSNLFWKLLHSSGLTPRRYAPSEHKKLPGELSLGNTNIVARPTKNGAQLSKAEMDDGVAVLERKIRENRPEAVCIVGKSIWESVWRVRHGTALKKQDFRYGWQDVRENMGVVKGKGEWGGAKVFVATSTSGLAASMSTAEKEIIWKELGSWVQQRRKERSAAPAAENGGPS